MTVYTNALGLISGSGVLSIVNGINQAINSNASASAATNYFLKDNGNGVFVSTALPTGISFPTVTVTAATQAAVSNNRYSMNCSTAISILTLPASPAVGDTIQVSGAGLGSSFNFTVATNASQTLSTTAGTASPGGATLTSTQPGASITLYASTAGTSANWVVSQTQGNFVYAA